MKKPVFNKIVKNFKKNISNTNSSEINKLKTKFPYCELIHKISLIQAHNNDDINFNEILALSSLYSTNRRQLFTIINPKVAATSGLIVVNNCRLFIEYNELNARISLKFMSSLLCA